MSQLEEFDAYYKWLAIPPAEQPPNYYRLLGVQLFEENADVIDSAADARLTHLRSFQAGPRGEISQKISNEVSTARVCLLNAERRANYDAQLHELIAAEEQINSPPAMPPQAGVPNRQSSSGEHESEHSAVKPGPGNWDYRSRAGDKKVMLLAGVCALALFSIAAAIIWIATSSNETQAVTRKSELDTKTVDSNSVDSDLASDVDATNNLADTANQDSRIDDVQRTVNNSNANAKSGNPDSVETKADSNLLPDNKSEPPIKTTSGEKMSPTTIVQDNVEIGFSGTPPKSDVPEKMDVPVKVDMPATPDVPATPPDSPFSDPLDQTLTDVFDMTDSVDIPVTAPEIELMNSAELYEEYESAFLKFQATYRASVVKLKGQAIDAITALQNDASGAGDQEFKTAAGQMILSLESDEIHPLKISVAPSSNLGRIATKFNSELESRDKTFENNQREISKTYFDGIAKISRELKKKRKNEQSDYLRNYARLMEARIDNKPIAGKLAYLAIAGINNAVYLNGEKLKFDTGVSQVVRISPDDVIAIEYFSNQRYRAVNLTFISNDRKLYVPIHRSHVKKMPAFTRPDSITLKMIDDAVGAPEEGRIDPQLSKLHNDSGLPLEKQGGSQWFSGADEVAELYAIRITPSMLRSVEMDLTGLPEPDPEQMGEISSIKLEKGKGLLLVYGSDSVSTRELPVVKKACEVYGLPYVVTSGFNVNQTDFSKLHTIVCGSNEMRYWANRTVRDDPNAMRHVEKFINDGGHLFIFGSYGGSGMAPLANFGIHVDSDYGTSFAVSGNASSLFFYGNRRLVPRDQAVRSVGNFQCSVQHVPLLLRPASESDPDTPIIAATLEHGRGRITLVMVEPSYQNDEWIIPPAFSWISRGSPFPVEELKDGEQVDLNN